MQAEPDKAVRMNEERYREEIIKLAEEAKDEEYLKAVYTFAKTYPRTKKDCQSRNL